MKPILRSLIFTGLILFAFQNLKALHPAFQASLHDHMVEVNKEWLHQATAEGEFAQAISFDNDRDRIQTHLYGVIDILRDRTHELELSDSQQQHRLDMLNTLEKYAQEGTFPTNTGHSFRIPYFIDAYGTPCAVGHLLIESGFEEVAQRIKQEMNNAYVREIPYTELPRWADEYGFSVAELAWIQPGYPPANKWTPVGGAGANAPGHVIIKDSANDALIILGAFTDFNGVACHGAVRVDENGTTALDSFPLEGAKTAVFYQGKLWVGGLFPYPGGSFHNLMIWDGSTWEVSAIGFGDVNCLHVHNGKLYAGGDFLSALLDNLAVYDQANEYWIPYGTYLGSIKAMTTYKGELVVGGEFSPNSPADVYHIARWDGSLWQPLATGGDTIDSPVLALRVDGQKLYAGGELVDSSGVSSFGLANIEDPNAGWQYMLPNNNIFHALPGLDSVSSYINNIQIHDGRVFLSGSFFMDRLFKYGFNLGIYDSAFSGFLDPIGDFSSPVTDMLVANGKVYATGSFIHPRGYVLETDAIVNSLPSDPQFDALVVFPNPASDIVTFQWDTPTQGMNMVLDVYDMTGRKLTIEYQVNAQSIRLNRGQLPVGAYAFVLKDGKKSLNRGRFIFK